MKNQDTKTPKKIMDECSYQAIRYAIECVEWKFAKTQRQAAISLKRELRALFESQSNKINGPALEKLTHIILRKHLSAVPPTGNPQTIRIHSSDDYKWSEYIEELTEDEITAISKAIEDEKRQRGTSE